MSEALAYTPWPDRRNLAVADELVRRPRRLEQNPVAMTSREVLSATSRPARTYPVWLPDVITRVIALSRRPLGWDSYGGRPLDLDVASSTLVLLRNLSSLIQAPPSISLTAEGGLSCEWRSDNTELLLNVEPDAVPLVYFSDELSEREWEGQIDACPMLEKWLWQASAQV
jgi:hypothetical protein